MVVVVVGNVDGVGGMQEVQQGGLGRGCSRAAFHWEKHREHSRIGVSLDHLCGSNGLQHTTQCSVAPVCASMLLQAMCIWGVYHNRVGTRA